MDILSVLVFFLVLATKFEWVLTPTLRNRQGCRILRAWGRQESLHWHPTKVHLIADCWHSTNLHHRACWQLLQSGHWITETLDFDILTTQLRLDSIENLFHFASSSLYASLIQWVSSETVECSSARGWRGLIPDECNTYKCENAKACWWLGYHVFTEA